MELWEEIICKATNAYNENVFEDNSAIYDLLNSACYVALSKIKQIIENDDLDDDECFERIEKIVCVFEELGSDGGNRHDFG